MFHVPFYNLDKDCCHKTVAATFAFLWFVCFWLLFECEMHLLCFVRKFVCVGVHARVGCSCVWRCVCVCRNKKSFHLVICTCVARSNVISDPTALSQSNLLSGCDVPTRPNNSSWAPREKPPEFGCDLVARGSSGKASSPPRAQT
mmetsp:Transcript_55287/g.89579  ORF Transcript_55287/g.89579 Transcript_55287/m.89579 type:complete len:145 (-) Transcript_55287:357-791(-)